MYEIKKQIYQDLSKNQKSALCNYLRAYVKKNINLKVDNIWNSFIEDEKYYMELNCSRFEFLENYIQDDLFKTDTLKYINECKKYYEYKEKQKPLLEMQKNYEKQKREFLKEVKMSKEEPTKKQLYYYEKLCNKYNIEKKELKSKLDAKNEIDKIITEHDINFYNNRIENEEL